MSHKIKFSPKPPTGGFAQFFIKKTVKWKTGTMENWYNGKLVQWKINLRFPVWAYLNKITS